MFAEGVGLVQLQERWDARVCRVSMITVKGPLFTKDTFIMAPKRPVAVSMPRA